jgi:hypothetical protein
MTKQLIIKVPQIMKDRGITVEDLRWGARLALNTAKRWADPDEAQFIDRIEVTTLVDIADFLGIDDIGELLVIEGD